DNQTLREENNLLSRRRRAKKTRLRQGGSLTLGEGEDMSHKERQQLKLMRKRAGVVVAD
ncbi:hypothetical protein CSPAE12_05932, partial [Colletotrichum incanum]